MGSSLQETETTFLVLHNVYNLDPVKLQKLIIKGIGYTRNKG